MSAIKIMLIGVPIGATLGVACIVTFVRPLLRKFDVWVKNYSQREAVAAPRMKKGR